MNTEELMIPRRKIIAPYPLSDKYFKVGEILYWNNELEFYETHGGKMPVRMAKDTVENYPHLFKKLEWHEDRKESDMPEYFKANIPEMKGVFKVYKWVNQQPEGFHFIAEKPFVGVALKNVLPATKQEFEEYESQK